MDTQWVASSRLRPCNSDRTGSAHRPAAFLIPAEQTHLAVGQLLLEREFPRALHPKDSALQMARRRIRTTTSGYLGGVSWFQHVHPVASGQRLFRDLGDLLQRRHGIARKAAQAAMEIPYGACEENPSNGGKHRIAQIAMQGRHGARRDAALEAIARFDPGVLIVSFGADTFEGDPIANFALKTSDYAMLAQDIAATGLPTVVLTEGGYAVDNLGENLASFLSGF